MPITIETETLLQKTLLEIYNTYPWIKYILVADVRYAKAKKSELDMDKEKPEYTLVHKLLKESEHLTPGVQEMLRVVVREEGTESVFAGLFKLARRNETTDSQ